MCLSTGFNRTAIEGDRGEIDGGPYIVSAIDQSANAMPILPSSVGGSSDSDGLYNKIYKAMRPGLE